MGSLYKFIVVSESLIVKNCCNDWLDRGAWTGGTVG